MKLIEQDCDDFEQTQFSMEEKTEQITIEQWNRPLEMKKKFVSISEKFSIHTHKIMRRGVSDDRAKTRCKRKRDMIDHPYAPVEDKSPVLKRAEEVQAKLGSKFPSIIKLMLRSNVTSGFWMNFSRRFCDLHLPKGDASVIVVDEMGEEYRTNFLWHKAGLSGGWKAYSLAHNLHEGDVLVFQFVKPTKCKVYTVRCDEFSEVDGALSLLELASSRIESERDIKTCYNAQQNCSDFFMVDVSPQNTMNRSSVLDDSEIIPHDLGRNTSKFMRCSVKDVKKVEDSIQNNNDFNIASEPIDTKIDITETCKLSKYHANYPMSDNFDLFGMNVGFLGWRVDSLVELAYKSKEACESKRYREATDERTFVDIMSTLELKCNNKSENVSKRLNLKGILPRKHGLSLQEELDVQW